MPLWDCEVLSINSVGALHPIKLCFTNLVFVLNLCIGSSLKEESNARTVTFFPSTPNYTSLWFLTCFSAEMAVPGRLCFYLLGSRSRQLNLMKDERVLKMWHSGFAQHHWQHTCCHSTAPAWSETGRTAGQSTLFDQIMAPTTTRLSLMRFISVCLWVSPQRFAGFDLSIAKAIPPSSGSTDYLANVSWLHLFRGLHTAVHVRARHQQPILMSGWQSFVNRGQRENTNIMWEQSWWLSCTKMNHQFKFNPSFSSWQGLWVLIRQQTQLVQACLISLYLSCSPVWGTSNFPCLEWWFSMRVLWVMMKGEVQGCDRKRRNLHFWRGAGRTDFEMWQ